MRAKFVGGELDGAEFDLVVGMSRYVHHIPEHGITEIYERTNAASDPYVEMSLVSTER